MSATSVSDRKSTVILAAMFLFWIVTYFGAREVLKQVPLETWQRIGVALIPVPFFAACVVLFIRGIRQMDELQKRIQLEALAVAYPVGLVFLMTLGLMQRAVELKFEDWSYGHIVPYFVIFYIAGIALAVRRYQ